VFVTAIQDDTVTVINTKEYTVSATLKAGDKPYGVATSPDNRYMMVANQGSNDLWLFDQQSLEKLAEIKVGEMPESVSVSSDSQRAYVTNWFSNDLSVVDLDSRKQIQTLPVSESPRSLGHFIAP
jgi:YVTN family beta-propeller protein